MSAGLRLHEDRLSPRPRPCAPAPKDPPGGPAGSNNAAGAILHACRARV